MFDGPLGRTFFKEGSDDGTNNLAFGLVRQRSGVVMLSNSSNAPRLFYPALEAALGHTCVPWCWMGYVPYDRPDLLADGAPRGGSAGGGSRKAEFGGSLGRP